MKRKGFFKRVGFGAIVIALTGLTAFATTTGIVNGDFSIPDLYGWTVYPGGSVFAYDGKAIFSESSSLFGTLSQKFTISAPITGLSFDFQYFSGGTNETYKFTTNRRPKLFLLGQHRSCFMGYDECDTLLPKRTQYHNNHA